MARHILGKKPAVRKPRFKAALTQEQVFQAEERWGVKRRITLLTLTSSSADLIKLGLRGDKGGEVIATMLEQVSDYLEHIEKEVELAKSAFARLAMVADYILINSGERGLFEDEEKGSAGARH